MLDDLYQEGTDKALQDLVRRPMAVPPPASGFSMWKTLTAAPRGAAAGVSETLAFGSDVLGAFGDVTAGYASAADPATFLGPDRDKRQREVKQAQDRVQSADAFSSTEGDAVRGYSRETFMPDPTTSHAAEQVVFGFSRLVTKAVGYGATAGPLGPLFVGADEGVTQSDELRLQGVDAATRTQAGLLGGLAAGVSVALPVAGVGVKSTAGLVAVGGPGMFIAQQAAAREILANAGYDRIADQYDPFDPVGLAVSALAPAAFGGFALRGRARAARAAETARLSEAAQLQDKIVHNQDTVDAARVNLAREIVDSWNLGKPGDIEAATNHMAAVLRASDQMATGQRVAINDLIPLEKAQTAKAIDQMITRFEAARAELLPEVGNRADPGVIRAARDELVQLRATPPDSSDATIRTLAKDIQAQQQVSYKRALSQATKQIEHQLADHSARVDRLEAQIEYNAAAVQAEGVLTQIDQQIGEARAARNAIDAPATDLTPIVAAVREVVGTPAGTSRAVDVPRAPEAPVRSPASDGPGAPARAAGDAPQANAPAAPSRGDSGAPADTSAADPSNLTVRAAEVMARNPDAMVQLEGMDAPMRLADAMAMVEQEAARDIADAPLLKVAANCFLSR